jgi:hypothetical protein
MATFQVRRGGGGGGSKGLCNALLRVVCALLMSTAEIVHNGQSEALCRYGSRDYIDFEMQYCHFIKASWIRTTDQKHRKRCQIFRSVKIK